MYVPRSKSALRSLLPILLGLLLGALGARQPSANTLTPSRPNIVFILADDLGWNDVGYHGSAVRTPNIDKLAAEGTQLNQFYTLPLCSPSRAALMTGLYPMRYGMQERVVPTNSRLGLPLVFRTLANGLKEAGYDTALCGKWHLGGTDNPAYAPLKRGFDHHYGFRSGVIDYYTHRDELHRPDWYRDNERIVERGYATELLGTEAVRIISEQPAETPLFLMLTFNAVHTPLQVPDKYLAGYPALRGKRKLHAAMVSVMDQEIGKVLDALEARQMLDNTLIVVSSDNGGEIHHGGGSNLPLRADKNTLYEGGVRVPTLVYFRGRTPATVVDEPLHVVDWYTTLLNLAGAPPYNAAYLDGRDIWPVIAEGAASPHAELLLNAESRRAAIRVGHWKLIQYQESEELFDLASDPNEEHSLATAQPKILDEVGKRLRFYRRQAVPSIFGERLSGPSE